MFFKKYDMAFDYDKKCLPVVENQISELLDNDDGPDALYVFTHNETTVKKSTIKGTGVNSFAPVIRINLTEMGEKVFVRFDFSAFKATEIVFAIIMTMAFLFMAICLFTRALAGVFGCIGMILLILALFYGCYTLFLNKSIKNIVKIFSSIE